MDDKHFICNNIHFTQRASDNCIDATQICQSKKKLFANWFRTKTAKKCLEQHKNPLILTNRHTWIIPECLPELLKWILKTDFDFNTIQQELDKPFPKGKELPPITSKVCSKCHEDLSIDNFGPNKLKSDGYDIRCKGCYKEERTNKADNHASRSLEYYHANKEKCIAKKTEWNKKNKDKVNEANRKSHAKKKALKEEKELEESNKLAENILSNITIQDKNDNPYSIICRESDGYINISNLCKAGGRHFKTWNNRSRTKEFLHILNDSIKSEYQQKESGRFCPATLNAVIELIKYDTAYGENRGTWVHPKVAINIAQWISPKFDVQVSKWVHQLLVVGKVSLTDEHNDGALMDIQKNKVKYNRLVGEGKEEEADKVVGEISERIEELEKKNKELEDKYKESLEENNRLSKYLERKKRIQYNKGKCIYILRHKEFKDCYKVGIANELTSRMSTYNTAAPEDFELIYHKHTIYNSVVEIMVKKKLVDYLFSNNKEWYQVNEGPEILIDNVKRAVEFFDNDF